MSTSFARRSSFPFTAPYPLVANPMSQATKPPPKPVRPPPLPAGLSYAKKDIVPGYPDQSRPIKPVAPQVIERAREAARHPSSPDLVDFRLNEIEREVSHLDKRMDAFDRVANAVEGLVVKVDEWELANSGSEIAKVQEEQKTKRFQMIVGVLMFLCTTGGTIITNIVMNKDAPPVTPPPPVLSANDRALALCAKEPSPEKQGKCALDIAIANIPPPQR